MTKPIQARKIGFFAGKTPQQIALEQVDHAVYFQGFDVWPNGLDQLYSLLLETCQQQVLK